MLIQKKRSNFASDEYTYLYYRGRETAQEPGADTRGGTADGRGVDIGVQGVCTVEDIPHIPRVYQRNNGKFAIGGATSLRGVWSEGAHVFACV